MSLSIVKVLNPNDIETQSIVIPNEFKSVEGFKIYCNKDLKMNHLISVKSDSINETIIDKVPAVHYNGEYNNLNGIIQKQFPAQGKKVYLTVENTDGVDVDAEVCVIFFLKR